MVNSGEEKLIIIGGAEDKENSKVILKYIAEKIGDDEELLIATVASEEPQKLITKYKEVFNELKVKNIKELSIVNREECWSENKINLIKSAKVIFFTGGDQLRITSLLGGTPIYESLIKAFSKGTIFVGTSAGASVMSDTMWNLAKKYRTSIADICKVNSLEVSDEIKEGEKLIIPGRAII